MTGIVMNNLPFILLIGVAAAAFGILAFMKKRFQERSNGMKRAIRILDGMVNLMIIICFLPVLLYGIYGIWDSRHIYHEAENAQFQKYKPDLEQGLSFEMLQKINPEVFGWLTVEDTHIDYPLVQAEGNSKYVNTNVKGEFSLSGSIFLDCRNQKDFSDCNHVIYGHHMQENSMFGELENFQDQSYFDKHRSGEIYYDGAWHKIEFFAFVPSDAYDPVLYNTELLEEDNDIYLDYVRTHAERYRELDFGNRERFVALSTCTSESSDGRHILVGRITNQIRNAMGDKRYGD